MKKVIRLTESDIRNIVKKSVNRVLREYGSDGPDFDDYEVPGYEGTNVPDGSEYNELYPEEDFDEFLGDAHYMREPNIGDRVPSASDIDSDEDLLNMESRRRMGKIIRESIKKVMREASVYPGYDSSTTAGIAGSGEGNIITCYGSPGVISGKFRGAHTILGPGVIYLSCNPPTMGMTRMYGQLVPVKVDVSNFYRAKDTFEAKKMVGLAGFKDKYSGILYHGNRDGDVCAIFDRNCIIG